MNSTIIIVTKAMPDIEFEKLTVDPVTVDGTINLLKS